MAEQVEQGDLIDDILALNKANPGNITRNYYRAKGKYTEAMWQQHFPRFSDFLSAAGLNTEPETNEIQGDTWQVSLPNTDIHTLDQLVEYCQADLKTWEVDRFSVLKKDTASEPRFDVRANFKKRGDMLFILQEVEELKNEVKADAKRIPAIRRSAPLSGNMLEINIPDAHVGKLAWGTETGWENYDTKIADAMFRRALDTLLDRSRGYKFDEVVFVVGNDLFNSDDLEGRTTKGTQVTTDGRYFKTYLTVRKTICACIERLRQIAPVRVVMVSGNHDSLSVWHLGDSLECKFDGYEDVFIDNLPRTRKYHQFGNVMLMFTHGDKVKREEYPLLMATEQPLMFGQTLFRECHCGHTHETKLQERHGVRVRVLPALCPPDDWHSENGYVGNQRNAEAYVWNSNEGLIAQFTYNDNSQPTLVTKRELVN